MINRSPHSVRALGAPLVLAVSACASANDPGSTGTDATPFDQAKARCQIETQTVEGEAFYRCMEGHGWRRPR